MPLADAISGVIALMMEMICMAIFLLLPNAHLHAPAPKR
jgi:hypothetical protein